MCGGRAHMGNKYLPLNFVVNLKTTLKIIFFNLKAK